MEHAEKLGVASSLMFQPVEPRDDITKEVPKDLNPFTEHYYQLSSSGDSLEDIDSTEPSLEFLRTHAPKDYHKFIDEDNLRTNGEFSDEYGLMTWSVFEWAHDTGNLPDRKSTRLNSSHVAISYAVFCLKKTKNTSMNIEKLYKN